MNFAGFDLNLLRVFDAMMIELSTVKAGERVGLTQPAVSAAVGRLRHILRDDLFVREGNRMVATPRALALQEPVRTALRQLEAALFFPAGFDPKSTDRNFFIAGSDYVSTFLMPRLLRLVRSEAPGATLQMLDFLPARQVFAGLTEGKVDIAVEREMDAPEWIAHAVLHQSFVVCIARRGHPALSQSDTVPGGRIDPETYCRIPQVILSTDGSKVGSVHPQLRRLGLSRTVELTVPHFQAVALAVAGSDLLGSLPIHFARYAARLLNLNLYLPPFDPPVIQMRMYWHRRSEQDPAQVWLREKIATAMGFDTTYPPANLRPADTLPWEG